MSECNRNYMVVVRYRGDYNTSAIMAEFSTYEEGEAYYLETLRRLDPSKQDMAWSLELMWNHRDSNVYGGWLIREFGTADAKPRIYIAGPMTGHPDMNAPRFFEAERSLRAAGWEVINPARMDEEAGIEVDNKTELTPEEYMQAAKRDLIAIDECDAVYFLDEYETSPGAKWEWAYAKTRGLTMYYQTPKADGVERRQVDD